MDGKRRRRAWAHVFFLNCPSMRARKVESERKKISALIFSSLTEEIAHRPIPRNNIELVIVFSYPSHMMRCQSSEKKVSVVVNACATLLERRKRVCTSACFVVRMYHFVCFVGDWLPVNDKKKGWVFMAGCLDWSEPIARRCVVRVFRVHRTPRTRIDCLLPIMLAIEVKNEKRFFFIKKIQIIKWTWCNFSISKFKVVLQFRPGANNLYRNNFEAANAKKIVQIKQ